MIAITIDGKIKTFSTYPTKWKVDGVEISPYQFATDRHYDDGFREVVRPTVTETQKLGELYFDEVNDVFTYQVVDKSPEEIEQENANQLAVQRAEIKERYVKIVVEDKIALNPTDAAIYFDEWTAGSYELDAIVNYKGKTYRNTVDGNTNAPDKGGWIEIK